VQAVIRGRLSRLDAPSRDFVSAVAVFRRALDFDEVRSVAGQDEGAALAASEALVGAQILREVPIPLAAGMVVHRYAFAHEQFRRVVYAGLSDARRRVLHRHALELLADAGDDQAEEMAYHACRGELWSGGLDWSERAAADAMALFACAPAVHLYEQALTCAGQLRPTPELRRRVIDLRLRLAEAGFYVQPSRLSEWLAPAQADAAALGDVGRQAQVGLAQASAVYIRGHFTTALPHLERLQAMAESTCDQGLRARTANVLGRLLVIRGELRRGGAALEHALAATEAANGQEPIWPATAIERLVSIGLLASAQAFLGEFAAAEQTMARCRSLVAASGDPSARAAAAFYDALVAQTHGEWARATTLANEAIAQARSAANLIYEYVTHVYLGPALARQGRVAEGLAVQRAALELADRAQIQVILGRAHAWLGEILLLDGKPEEAYDAARRGEVLSDEHGYLLEAAMCTRVRGEAAMAMGAWAEAEEALASASSALSELEAWPEWARTQLALGHLASALGEHESSRCHFERASERFAAMGMSPAALIPSSRPT
jgi:tetratricopeptide (TPR) repeat protein